jgi:hypothetical protein
VDDRIDAVVELREVVSGQIALEEAPRRVGPKPLQISLLDLAPVGRPECIDTGYLMTAVEQTV